MEECYESNIHIQSILVKDLKTQFEPKRSQLLFRNQLLLELEQKESVRDYILQFQDIMSQITQMNEDDKISYFIKGLKARSRSEISFRAPKLLNEAINMAIQFEQANNYSPVSFKSSSSTNILPRDESSPMEISTMQVKERRRQIECFYCQKLGHIEKDCRKKKYDESNKWKRKQGMRQSQSQSLHHYH